MKMALIYAKFLATPAAFFGYLAFAFHLNHKLEHALSGGERATLVSLSILGAYILIAKTARYLSAHLIR